MILFCTVMRIQSLNRNFICNYYPADTYSVQHRQNPLDNRRFNSSGYIYKKNPSFTGLAPIEKLLTAYLKNKALKRSVIGSKRPYVPIDSELEKSLKKVKIQVSPAEEIEAFDINPDNRKKYLLFLHGFSQNITNNQLLYKSLLNTDYGVLAIDYRAYGKNPASRHISEHDMQKDIQASLRYLNDKGIKKIGLIGHSFGSYLSAKTSKKENIQFQILVSPMMSLELWLKKVIRHPKKYPKEYKMIKFIPLLKRQYKRAFNIAEPLKDNQTPTYFITSKRDKYVRDLRGFSKSIENTKICKILEDGGHSLEEHKINAITELIKHL